MQPSLWRPEVEALSWAETLESLHAPLLARQLERVLGISRFYRDKLSQAGWDLAEAARPENFFHLPFTDKPEIIQDQSQCPPFGRLLAVEMPQVSRVHRTSGSSGRPVLLALTPSDLEANLESGARAFRCAGVGPGEVVVHCLNYSMWMGGLSDHLALERAGAAVVPFGVGNSKQLLEVISFLRPTAISCTPSYMDRLATLLRQEFQREPRELGLKMGLFGGEPGIQIPERRQQLEDTWGIQAVDANYGMSDVLSIFGSECACRQGLHFHGAGILHVELIDPSSQRTLELAPGAVGEMVLTSLVSQAQPLLRYRSHDLVKILGTDACACGRGGFRFRVMGRSDEMIVIKGINLYPDAVAEMVVEFADTFSGLFQIVLTSPPPHSEIGLRVEARPGVPQDQLSGAAGRLAQRMRQKLGLRPEVSVLGPGGIAGEDNKTRRVVRQY